MRRAYPEPLRFIPACAGNAADRESATPFSPVHPRVCGERASDPHDGGRTTGSSPRVRGTRAPRTGRNARPRFIPACAGNADTCPSAARITPVHPRVCGERRNSFGPVLTRRGSSPRVRGTRHRHSPIREHERFIPACAGNATPFAPSCTPAAVHPRVCGERTPAGYINQISPGSSPRVRGTPPDCVFLYFRARFIPACAGNARSSTITTGPASVHPRVCGERKSGGRIRADQRGSSPRVRGTPEFEILDARPVRFIPACAGNAARQCRYASAATVHPRVCGERGVGLGVVVITAGSSPRVRGTRGGLRLVLQP